jgi:hypothetical protein
MEASPGKATPAARVAALAAHRRNTSLRVIALKKIRVFITENTIVNLLGMYADLSGGKLHTTSPATRLI